MSRTIETITHTQLQVPCKTADQMEKICCETTGALQCCEEVIPAWGGYTDQEILDRLGLVLDEAGRDAQGRYVSIEIQPRTKPCGETVTQYDTSANNCCDEVEPIVIDLTSTPDILPSGKSIWLYWDGGQGPFTVRTTSNGTFFADGRKTVITSGNALQVFAGETFCGNTSITVSDSCNTDSVVIRGDQGYWALVGHQCQQTGIKGTQVSTNLYEATSGKFKYVEQIDILSWQSDLALYCVGDMALEPNQPGCLNGADCGAQICAIVAGTRPEEAVMDTCLVAPVADQLNETVEQYCTLNDGAIVADMGGLMSFDCRGLVGGGASGSTYIKGGYYLKTNNLDIYEWRC